MLLYKFYVEVTDYIKHHHYNELTTHGLMKNYTTSELSHLIDELRFKGYLNENDEILCVIHQ